VYGRQWHWSAAAGLSHWATWPTPEGIRRDVANTAGLAGGRLNFRSRAVQLKVCRTALDRLQLFS
jgi:hypothetical protein